MTEEKKPIPFEGEMIEEAFRFWFNDDSHIRSPFPQYIREELRMKTLDRFFDWTRNVPDKVAKDINDEIVAEKFEEILFETASGMVQTYDEKLTILYPFLPRLGDMIYEKNLPEGESESTVVDRLHIKKEDHAFLKVKCRNNFSGKEWFTEFELPE